MDCDQEPLPGPPPGPYPGPHAEVHANAHGYGFASFAASPLCHPMEPDDPMDWEPTQTASAPTQAGGEPAGSAWRHNPNQVGGARA